MTEELRADFGIEVSFALGTPDPSRVFRSMTALIESFQSFDRELVQTIDVKIEPVLLLEDIEIGSLKTWLRNAISSVDDSALRDGDWKKVVGAYLLRSKYILVRKLDGKTEITNRQEIKEIEAEIWEAAKATDVQRIPTYRPISDAKIIEVIGNLTAGLHQLTTGDSAKLLTPDGEANFNLSLNISPDSLRDLLVKESVSNDATLILKVKRPDYLGESMWDFKLGDHPLQAKIVDLEWLLSFQERKVDVRPGDAIRAVVRQTIHYGYEAQVVYEHNEIIQVLDVIAVAPYAKGHLLRD
jgi:hypothetical protein